MENEPEVIREQMQDTRTDLSEKLEALEERVMGVANAVSDTVENVKEGIADTVESVKDSVAGTVESVTDTVSSTVESVKDTFNLYKQVDRHPLALLGGSIGVGFLIGMLMPGRRRRKEPAAPPEPSRSEQQPPARPEPSRPPVMGGVLNVLTEGLTNLKNRALGSLVGLVKETVVKAVPSEFGEQVQTVLDNVASALTGSAPPRDESHQGKEEHQRSAGESHEEGHQSAVGNESKMGRTMGSTAW
jgi:ElaB/YqjD/DUF883 family membrane-anchored ribosome-binding protein